MKLQPFEKELLTAHLAIFKESAPRAPKKTRVAIHLLALAAIRLLRKSNPDSAIYKQTSAFLINPLECAPPAILEERTDRMPRLTKIERESLADYLYCLRRELSQHVP